MQLGLSRMQEACARAGHPERSFEVVHIGGTNGKGSTAAMVESIARAHGHTTGLYTSPHLCRFAERIRVNGEPIDDAALAEALETALKLGTNLSFFETATLAAFLAFRARGVSLGIVEVGIGGRFDATNVVAEPRVTAITRVAFDHMDRLGPTLEDIAREKAGIAKAGRPLVLGPMTEGPRRVIESWAHEVGARVVHADRASTSRASERRLSASYQASNAAIAEAIARELGWDGEAVARGLRTATWPGRFERIDLPHGPYLLDGAHNPDGARALAQSLKNDPDFREKPMAVVFGAMADKAWAEVLDILAEHISHRVYVAPKGRSAAPTDELAARHTGRCAADVEAALGEARAAVGPSGVVLVTGSLYLVGEARARLLGLPQDPPVAL